LSQFKLFRHFSTVQNEFSRWSSATQTIMQGCRPNSEETGEPVTGFPCWNRNTEL
jgi:hypothetical protein